MVLIGIMAFLGLIYMIKHPLGVNRTHEAQTAPTPAIENDKTNSVKGLRGNTRRFADVTESEKAELADVFNQKLKPAVARWCKAYEGHLPFAPEDVTLDKFHSTLAGFLYTFMIGDTTLTIASHKGSNDNRVFYVMTRDAARALNSIPSAGTVPVLSLPVNREEVLQMVKTDTGVDYQPNQVVIKPTGVACALNGGAFVEVGKQYLNGMEVGGSGLSFVVNSNGTIVNFQN